MVPQMVLKVNRPNVLSGVDAEPEITIGIIQYPSILCESSIQKGRGRRDRSRSVENLHVLPYHWIESQVRKINPSSLRSLPEKAISIA